MRLRHSFGLQQRRANSSQYQRLQLKTQLSQKDLSNQNQSSWKKIDLHLRTKQNGL